MNTAGRDARKAQTRERIIRAADTLFATKGYVGTSMEDISMEADVAIRTIYLHFESKAAVLLAYFDAWLDEFIRLVGERPVGERIDDAVIRTLTTMSAEGWRHETRVEELETVDPGIDFLGGGNPEVAGHVFQSWVQAQDRLAERFRETAGLPVGDPAPYIEAAAVFAAWVTTAVNFRARVDDRIPGAPAGAIGMLAIRAYANGLEAAT